MKRGTPEHPKMLMLASVLEISNYAAVGIMECLWHFTARYAPQGDIGKYSDEIIANKIGWDGDENRLIQALLECGWLEQSNGYRLLIHDWHDHCDDTCDRYLAKYGRNYASGASTRRKSGGQGAPEAGKCAPEGGKNEIKNGGQGAPEGGKNEVKNGGQGGKSLASQSQSQSQNQSQGGVGGKSSSKFKKPTLQEIKEYCEKKGYDNVDPLVWYAHYESNGWKVGKVAMKDWKGAVVTWAYNSLRGKEPSSPRQVYKKLADRTEING